MDSDLTLETVAPCATPAASSRRKALHRILKFGVSTMAAPVVLSSLQQNAQAANKDIDPGVFSVLRFALLLERLEHDFYHQALKTPGLIPDGHRAIFETIEKHEADHVALLATATLHVVETDEFDFTARGRFPDVFQNYRTFLALSQAFEDTGVRAYKGQATNLTPVGALLTIALTIHSVEARDAAEVRRIRGEKAWTTGSSRGSEPAIAQAIYNGEGNTLQGGVQLAGIGNTPATAASEAFDEPLSRSQVLNIVRPFVVKSSVLNN